MIKFQIKNKEYPIVLNMWVAAKVYPEKFDIELTSMFEGNNLDDLLQRMFLGDELALKLLEYYTSDDSDFEDILRTITTSELKQFKDAWWDAVMDFFDPLRREFLRDLLAQAPKAIKAQLKKSVNQLLDSGSSSLQPSPE